MTDAAFFMYPEIAVAGVLMMVVGGAAAAVIAPAMGSTTISLALAVVGLGVMLLGVVVLSYLLIYTVKHGT